jgi:cytochrome b561
MPKKPIFDKQRMETMNKRLFKIVVYLMLFAMIASTVLMSIGSLVG